MIKELVKTPLGRLRIVGFLEGCSYLLLFITMVIKYNYKMPLPNLIVGMSHGILFITYIFLVMQVSYIKKWNFKTIFLASLASFIPFGTFYADYKIFSKTF
jgi:integral membrane protein